MDVSVPEHKLVTAEEMRSAIDRILVRRNEQAYQSQYDVMVCVRSVDAARDAFEGVPVAGSAGDFGRAVDAALDTLQDKYYDSDGEYTSKGLIGDVGGDVYHLLETQKSSELVEIDREETRECLAKELAALAELTPVSPDDVLDGTIKTDVTGASGVHYVVAMVFEKIADGRFAIKGTIFCDKSCQFPLLAEHLELDSQDGN